MDARGSRRALHETQKQMAGRSLSPPLSNTCRLKLGTGHLHGIWPCLAWGPAHSRSRPGKQNRLEAGLGPAHARHTWRALLDARETRTDCNNNKLTPRHPVPRQAPPTTPRLPVGLSKQAKQGKARQGTQTQRNGSSRRSFQARHAIPSGGAGINGGPECLSQAQRKGGTQARSRIVPQRARLDFGPCPALPANLAGSGGRPPGTDGERP